MPFKSWDTSGASSYLGSLTQNSAVENLHSQEYYGSHRALVKLASQIEDDQSEDGLHALACASYGWMPTILKHFEPEKFNCPNPIASIRGAKTVNSARTFLEAIDEIAPINRSWVGTSKLLHFLSSESFPIWDSRVARRNFKLNHSYQINTKQAYLRYFDFVHSELAKTYSWLESVAEAIEAHHAYSPSRVRCIELMLFEREA